MINSLKVSTMTVTAQIPKCSEIILGNVPNQTKNNFKNQVSVKRFYNNETSRVSIKIFNSGRLQMTGIRTMNMFVDTYIYVLKLCEDNNVCELNVGIKDITPEWLKKHGCVKIEMINSNVNSGVKLNLWKVQDVLVNKYKILAMYKPINYAAVNAKFIAASGQTVSILLFSSGNVMITGSKSYDDLVEADLFRYDFINKNHDIYQISNTIDLIKNETNYNDLKNVFIY